MLRKRMRNVALLVALVIGTLAFGLARSAPVASQDDADAAAKIENAMSAAPSSISDNATILDNELDDAGNIRRAARRQQRLVLFSRLPRVTGE